MSLELFIDRVENLLANPLAISVEAGDGGLSEFAEPRALFFGEGSDVVNDYEVDGDTFSLNRDLKRLINGIMFHLTVGLNVELKITRLPPETALTLMRILDHTYALLVQACATDENKPPDAISCGLFCIKLEDAFPSQEMEDQIGILTHGILGGVKAALEEMVHGGVNIDVCMEMLQIIEDDLKIMLPFTAAGVFLKMEREDEYFKYPTMLNFDMLMGGVMGWVRLERVLSNVIPNFKFDISEETRQECLELMSFKLDKCEELIYKTGQLLKDGVDDKLRKMVQEVREIYKL